MFRLFAVLIVSCVASAAMADDSCTVQATNKHLAGAAKTSFTNKCAKDAATSCDAQAVAKKIYGAAKTSFTKKCVSDAVGQ